jgi:hypothetical protein
VRSATLERFRALSGDYPFRSILADRAFTFWWGDVVRQIGRVGLRFHCLRASAIADVRRLHPDDPTAPLRFAGLLPTSSPVLPSELFHT